VARDGNAATIVVAGGGIKLRYERDTEIVGPS
jgi:hypothetical protein